MNEPDTNGSEHRLDPRAQIAREVAKGGMGMVAIGVIAAVVFMLADVLRDKRETDKDIIAALSETLQHACGRP